MKLPINNRQTRHRLERRALREVFQRLADQTRRATPERTWADITLILLDDARIAPVNLAALGHDGPTDVITLAYDPDPADPGRHTGEILVNVQRAWEEGTRRGDPDHELALYIAHGCLHLTGADDLTPAGRASMSRTQNRWLKRARPEAKPLFINKELI